MDRRMILQRGAIAGGAALAAMAPLAAHAEDDSSDRQTLVGAWIGATNAGPGFPPFQALYTFAPGGGLVTSSSIDLSPRSLSTPGYGTWSRSGNGTFLFTFDAFVFDAQGNPSGVVKARSSVTLNKAGDAFVGIFKFDVIAPNGAIVFSGGGTHDGTRIRVETV
jgi:hypothetical protein